MTFFPRLSSRNLAECRKIRQSIWLLAIARAYVLKDAHAHSKRNVVEAVDQEKVRQFYPPTPCQMRSIGAPKAAIARLRKGNLGIDNQLGFWTGNFIYGLKLAGALAEKESGRYRIDTNLYPALVQDIAQWTLAGQLGKGDRSGRCRLIGCPAVTHLPPEDPEGSEVMAGLFAGARLRTFNHETWLEVPDHEWTRKLLDSWRIMYFSSIRRARHPHLKISPFYAPFFRDSMPAHSRARILSIRHSAMCPTLPILYWELGLSLLWKGMTILPFADALPFGISRRTFFRRGWRRSGLHRKAVLEFGIVTIDGRLKKLMHRWFETQQQQRSEKSQRIIQSALKSRLKS